MSPGFLEDEDGFGFIQFNFEKSFEEQYKNMIGLKIDLVKNTSDLEKKLSYIEYLKEIKILDHFPKKLAFKKRDCF